MIDPKNVQKQVRTNLWDTLYIMTGRDRALIYFYRLEKQTNVREYTVKLAAKSSEQQNISVPHIGSLGSLLTHLAPGMRAGAAGADTYWSEPEPVPRKRFARSRSRKKRVGSVSENGYNCGHATDQKRHLGLIRLRIFKMRWVSVANDHLGPKPLISGSATRRSLRPPQYQPAALDDN